MIIELNIDLIQILLLLTSHLLVCALFCFHSFWNILEFEYDSIIDCKQYYNNFGSYEPNSEHVAINPRPAPKLSLPKPTKRLARQRFRLKPKPVDKHIKSRNLNKINKQRIRDMRTSRERSKILLRFIYKIQIRNGKLYS